MFSSKIPPFFAITVVQTFGILSVSMLRLVERDLQFLGMNCLELPLFLRMRIDLITALNLGLVILLLIIRKYLPASQFPQAKHCFNPVGRSMKVPSGQGRQEVLRVSVQSVLTRLPIKKKTSICFNDI